MSESDESAPAEQVTADAERTSPDDFRSLGERLTERWRRWRTSRAHAREPWRDESFDDTATGAASEVEEPFVYPVARRSDARRSRVVPAEAPVEMQTVAEPARVATPVAEPVRASVAEPVVAPVVAPAAPTVERASPIIIPTPHGPAHESTVAMPAVIFPVQRRDATDDVPVWSEKTGSAGRWLAGVGGAIAAVAMIAVASRSMLHQRDQSLASADSALSFAQPAAPQPAPPQAPPPQALPRVPQQVADARSLPPAMAAPVPRPTVAPSVAASASTPVAARVPAARRRRVRVTSLASGSLADEEVRRSDRAPAGVTVRLVAETMIASYAAAIEARDIGRLERAYPALTSSERASWERFFHDAARIDARLTVEDFRILSGGDAASARITGWYAYETTAGRDGWERVKLDAMFRQTPSGAWRLARIR